MDENHGSVHALKAANDSRAMATAWTAAAEDLQKLAEVILRRRLNTAQVASELNVPENQVDATVGIDIDYWYGSSPLSWTVQFRNTILGQNGLDDFIVTDARPARGSLSKRLLEYVDAHPGTELRVLLAVFDEDALFGWDVATAVATEPNLQVIGTQVYVTMSVSDLRNEVWLAINEDDIWVRHSGGWVLATDAPGRSRSDVAGWRSRNPLVKAHVDRQLKSLTNAVTCVGVNGKELQIEPANNSGSLVVWRASNLPRTSRSTPPGWQRDERGYPVRG